MNKLNKLSKLTGFEVYGWPEFQAFAERLGIPLGNKTKFVSIHLYVDEVVISHEYVGQDRAREDIATSGG